MYHFIDQVIRVRQRLVIILAYGFLPSFLKIHFQCLLKMSEKANCVPLEPVSVWARQ